MSRVAQIARIAHEANRTYCATIGDTTQLSWADAPEWQRESAMKGVIFHWDALKKGETPSPSASHDSWLAEKEATGWTYGPLKSAELKQHPCCVAYEELPIEQRLKDYLFANVVAAFYEAEEEPVSVEVVNGE